MHAIFQWVFKNVGRALDFGVLAALFAMGFVALTVALIRLLLSFLLVLAISATCLLGAAFTPTPWSMEP